MDQETELLASGVAVLRGTIVHRRVLGRSLAFADISVEQQVDAGAGTVGTDAILAARIVSVIFQRHVVQTTEFPVKKSSLPFGALIEIAYRRRPDVSDTKLDVVVWKVLTDPYQCAMDVAAIENGGISCTDYLRARGEDFRRAKHVQQHLRATTLGDSSEASLVSYTQWTTDETVTMASMDQQKEDTSPTNSSLIHGNPRAKGLRARIFAAWMVEHLLELDGTDQVLDVAGGKGQLSLALASSYSIPCTVVDLLQRKHNASLRTTVKHLNQENKPIPTFVTQPFPLSHEPPNDTMQRLIHQHSCLVGLHPDQCTEAILDVALAHDKSVAIIPCCVFPSLFPMRMIPNVKAAEPTLKLVQTYDDFLLYLLQKDARLRRVTLPFDGKNECIYMKVSSKSTAVP